MDARSHTRIIFMPGMDGTGISFEPLIRLLPQEVAFTVVRYPSDRPLTFEQTLRCAEAQIPGDPDVVLVAESFSGLVAASLLGSGRIGARALVLCAAFARSPRPILFSLLGCLPLSGALRLPLPRRIMARTVDGGAASVDVFYPLYQRIQTMVSPQVLIARLGQINTVDVRPFLPRLTLPCAYLQAVGDRTIPAKALRDFQEAIPLLRIYRIRGPHFILQAKPHACWAAISDFMTHTIPSAG
jgi:pimeloyl-ACP methyl ester carboxylesterase